MAKSKKSRDMVLIVCAAVLALAIAVAVLMSLGKPTTPIKGDSCDCKVIRTDCCGGVKCVKNDVPDNFYTGTCEGVMCSQALYDDRLQWWNTYCECSGSECVEKINWTGVCKQICIDSQLRGGGPEDEPFWQEHCEDYKCEVSMVCEQICAFSKSEGQAPEGAPFWQENCGDYRC